MFSQVRLSTSVQPSTRDSAGTPSCRQRGTSRFGAGQPARLARSIWRTSNGTKSSCDLGSNFEYDARASVIVAWLGAPLLGGALRLMLQEPGTFYDRKRGPRAAHHPI